MGYNIEASNLCGAVTLSVTIQLRKFPKLVIEGIEVTQGLQVFWRPGEVPNSVPTVAGKDTIVRVYVSVDLDGFRNDEQPGVTGVLVVGGIALPPLNSTSDGDNPRSGPFIRARRRDRIQRGETNHTLNFRIPATLATGTKGLVARVIAPPIAVPFTNIVATPTATQTLSWTWLTKTPFKVRYILVSTGTVPAVPDDRARAALIKAFDLLPTPATDIAPAPVATWHTGVDLSTRDGVRVLLGHLDDQHDCAFSEWLFPWEEDCPDDDGAVWVGLCNAVSTGMAQGYQFDGVSRNTAVAAEDQKNIAHELGHTLGLSHVIVPFGQSAIGKDPDGPHDSLPNDGRIEMLDLFDPRLATTASGGLPYFDIMSYAYYRWTSRHNWERLLGKF